MRERQVKGRWRLVRGLEGYGRNIHGSQTVQERGRFQGFERLINVLKGGRNDQMRREGFSGSEETSRRQKCRVRRGNVNRPDGKKMSFQLGCFSSFIPKLHSSLWEFENNFFPLNHQRRTKEARQECKILINEEAISKHFCQYLKVLKVDKH